MRIDRYSSEDARRYWRRILNEVERGEQVDVTRYGRPLAAVVPVRWRNQAAEAMERSWLREEVPTPGKFIVTIRVERPDGRCVTASRLVPADLLSRVEPDRAQEVVMDNIADEFVRTYRRAAELPGEQ